MQVKGLLKTLQSSSALRQPFYISPWFFHQMNKEGVKCCEGSLHVDHVGQVESLYGLSMQGRAVVPNVLWFVTHTPRCCGSPKWLARTSSQVTSRFRNPMAELQSGSKRLGAGRRTFQSVQKLHAGAQSPTAALKLCYRFCCQLVTCNTPGNAPGCCNACFQNSCPRELLLVYVDTIDLHGVIVWFSRTASFVPMKSDPNRWANRDGSSAHCMSSRIMRHFSGTSAVLILLWSNHFPFSEYEWVLSLKLHR